MKDNNRKFMETTSPWRPDLCRPYRPFSANQYYILWHTLNKMNNNLQFIVRYHPWRAAAKHTGIIQSRPTTLRTSPLSAGARIWTNSPFADDPLEVVSSLYNGLALALHLFPRVHSDSFYAHLVFFWAVLCSGAILSSRIWRGAI